MKKIQKRWIWIEGDTTHLLSYTTPHPHPLIPARAAKVPLPTKVLQNSPS